MRKSTTVLGVMVAVLAVVAITCGFGWANAVRESELAALPVSEVMSGIRGEQFGVDANVNEETIDQYLGREDSVYRDMRLLVDPGDYEAIGGDSYLSGFVEGFEVVPLPYIVNVSGLPEEVGETYQGKPLCTPTEEGEDVANYDESMASVEYFVPKDKNIFLMCGGAGYAGMMKQMLVALGWDESRIYNVGGYWYYEGENKVEVKRELEDGEVVYDFWKVPYVEFDFDELHEVKE